MDIEKAFKAVAEWYDGDSFHIIGVTDTPKGGTANFDQHPDFISVKGWQSGPGVNGDDFHGSIYFEFRPGKYIATEFWT